MGLRPEEGDYWVPGPWVVAPARPAWTPGYGVGEGLFPGRGLLGSPVASSGREIRLQATRRGFAGGDWDRGALFYKPS